MFSKAKASLQEHLPLGFLYRLNNVLSVNDHVCHGQGVILMYKLPMESDPKIKTKYIFYQFLINKVFHLANKNMPIEEFRH